VLCSSWYLRTRYQNFLWTCYQNRWSDIELGLAFSLLLKSVSSRVLEYGWNAGLLSHQIKSRTGNLGTQILVITAMLPESRSKINNHGKHHVESTFCCTYIALPRNVAEHMMATDFDITISTTLTSLFLGQCFMHALAEPKPSARDALTSARQRIGSPYSLPIGSATAEQARTPAIQASYVGYRHHRHPHRLFSSSSVLSKKILVESFDER
jgi:hypothetical protein